MGALLRDLRWRASARWHYLKEDTSDLYWSLKCGFWEKWDYLLHGPKPPPTAEQVEAWRKQMEPLVKALEAGAYQQAPTALQQGQPLVIEDLSPVMACVTFDGPPHRLRGETKLSYWARSRWYRRKFLGLSFVYAVDCMPEMPAPEYYPWWPKFLREKPPKRSNNGQ